MTCTATVHGTATAYQAYGCRCEEARRAQARYAKRLALRHREGLDPLVASIGARRRIRALQTQGWPVYELMARMGLRSTNATGLMNRPQVRRATAQAVAALYDELWDQPGPSTRTAAWARAKGFPPPLAWDEDTIDDPKARPSVRPVATGTVDEIAVQRAVAGDTTVTLNKHERCAAVRILHARSYSDSKIADTLGIAAETVLRIRHRLHLPAVTDPVEVNTPAEWAS